MTSPIQHKTTIAPMLSVRGGASAVEFYKKAFHAEERFRIESDTGDVVARLAIEDAEFWVADESPAHKNFSPESLGGGTIRLVLTVDAPETVFQQAVSAGATVVTPIRDEHGWLVGRVADPFGHHWEIGKPTR
jgi:PhnB protein